MVITAIQEPTPPRDWYRSTVVEMKKHVSKSLTLRNPNGVGGGAADFKLIFGGGFTLESLCDLKMIWGEEADCYLNKTCSLVVKNTPLTRNF